MEAGLVVGDLPDVVLEGGPEVCVGEVLPYYLDLCDCVSVGGVFDCLVEDCGDVGVGHFGSPLLVVP